MDLYSEIILDRFKNPRTKVLLKTRQRYFLRKRIMRDKVKIYILLDKKGKIEKAKFEGEGCAISQASTDMLTEKLIGKSLAQIKKSLKKTC